MSPEVSFLEELLHSYGMDARAVLHLREGAVAFGRWALRALDDLPVALVGGPAGDPAAAIVSALSPEEAPLQRFTISPEGRVEGCFVSGARVAILCSSLEEGAALERLAHAVEAAGGEVVAALSLVDWGGTEGPPRRAALHPTPSARPFDVSADIMTEISARSWSAESRNAYRMQFDLKVDVSSSHLLFSAHTHDISRGGLFLATHAELSPGQQVSLRLFLPDGSEVSCKAKVKWCRPAGADDGPPGVGVEFLNLSPAARRALESLLSVHHNLAFPGEFPFQTGQFPSFHRTPEGEPRGGV